MKREIIKDGTIETVFSRFEDVHEFVEYALVGYENEKLAKLYWRGSLKREHPLGEWFTGDETTTAANVAAAVINPSPDFKKLDVEAPDVCDISKRCNVRRVRRGLDFGDDVDVERWLTRDLSCFEDVERVRAGRPSVRVVVEFGASYRMKHDYFVKFSSMLAAVVEMAESANVNISVDVCFSGRMAHKSINKHRVQTLIRLKSEDEMLDKNLLLYVCGGHAFYRTIALQANLRVSSEVWNLKIGKGGLYCEMVDPSITRGSFVVSCTNTYNAGDVLLKFSEFIEQGESVAAAC